METHGRDPGIAQSGIDAGARFGSLHGVLGFRESSATNGALVAVLPVRPENQPACFRRALHPSSLRVCTATSLKPLRLQSQSAMAQGAMPCTSRMEFVTWRWVLHLVYMSLVRKMWLSLLTRG